MFHTFAYKSAYIHVTNQGLKFSRVDVQDHNFKLHGPFKSVHAAKCFITRKLTNKKRGSK